MDYTPEPIDTSKVKLPIQLDELLEILAKNTHDLWAKQRIEEGWSHGPKRSDTTHPGLVPYDELPEEEKNYDRTTALEALKTIVALGYQITPPWHGNADAMQFKVAVAEVAKRLAIHEPIDLATLVSFSQTVSKFPELVGARVFRLLGSRILDIGEPLLAYDVISQGLTKSDDDLRLLQLKGLALARSGATLAANQLLSKLYSNPKHRDGETLGMLARTHKDLWEQASDSEEKEKHLQNSHRMYERAYRQAKQKNRIDDIIYNGINTATTGLLLGHERRARSIAATVQSACLRKRGYHNNYWTMATLGEASVIIKDYVAAEVNYERAAELGKGEHAKLAATRRNLRLLRGVRDCQRLEALFPIPSIVVFAGHIIDAPGRSESRFPLAIESWVRDQVSQSVDEVGECIGYSSAACGSDILFVEAMLKRKREVHLVLPLPPKEFERESVAIRGGDWANRFQSILKRVARVVVANEQRHSGAPVPYEYAKHVLCGTAMARARALAAEVKPLVVWDGNSNPRSGRTATFVSFLRLQGMSPKVINIRQARSTENAKRKNIKLAQRSRAKRTEFKEELFPQEIRAMLFADVVHYSLLAEEQVPFFVKHFLGAAADLVAQSADQPIVSNTWGDAFYFVFRNVTSAGEFALNLRDGLCGTRWEEHGLPKELSLRIALHAGPVYKIKDPIIRRKNYTGSHVSRAARIEPITPQGEVFASEPFAALAEIDKTGNFVCEYVGKLQLPKGFGTFPTYHLRRA